VHPQEDPVKHIAPLCLALLCACAAESTDDRARAGVAPGDVPVAGTAPAGSSPTGQPAAPGTTGAGAEPAAPEPVDVGGTAGAAAPGSMPPADAEPAPVDPGGATIDPNSPTGMHVEHPTGDTVRFIAVGDTGSGDANQLAVANAMANKCAADGCDFVVLLGDNIYDKGPASLDDPQWQLKFEMPYAALDVPFYVVLGNHDVAAEPLFGSGYAANQAILEVQYSERSDKWTMPATHYTLGAGPVGFLMLDTTSLYNHVVVYGDQHLWVGEARETLRMNHAWILSAGHHTYVSNGDHGNAGMYAYFDFDPGLEIKQFFETNLCGQIDVVMTGHDHNRQWLDPSLCGGTDVIVSGAGAKPRGLPGNNPVAWQSEELGFLYAVADRTTFTGQFIGADGSVDFERTLTKDAGGSTTAP
jgi:predicted phosphodiesterase